MEEWIEEQRNGSKLNHVNYLRNHGMDGWRNGQMDG